MITLVRGTAGGICLNYRFICKQLLRSFNACASMHAFLFLLIIITYFSCVHGIISCPYHLGNIINGSNNEDLTSDGYLPETWQIPPTHGCISEGAVPPVYNWSCFYSYMPRARLVNYAKIPNPPQSLVVVDHLPYKESARSSALNSRVLSWVATTRCTVKPPARLIGQVLILFVSLPPTLIYRVIGDAVGRRELTYSRRSITEQRKIHASPPFEAEGS